MIKSLSIGVEAAVLYKNKLDKEILDLCRRCYTIWEEKEDFYIFINRNNRLDYNTIAMIERKTLSFSELFCMYNLDVVFPEITLSSLPRYQYLNTISKFLTKENVQLKSIHVSKSRRLSLLSNDIEVANNTVMEDIKYSLYSHYKDDEQVKQPLSMVGEVVPDIIFKNIGEIITCSLNGLLEVIK